MPLLASKVATRFVFRTLPTLRSRKLTVTVSPMSTEPLGGEKLSAVRVAPAGAMLRNGGATTVAAVAVLSAGLGSACEAETVVAVESGPELVGVTTMVMVAAGSLAIWPSIAAVMVPGR